MPPFLDLTGKKFGRLTAIEREPNAAHTSWICSCECGESTVVRTCHLRSGHTSSCGCLYRETRNGKLSHGMTGSDEYKIWGSMINRCRNGKGETYKNYAGRGIKVCEKWLNSFEEFYNDMGPRPSPKHSIDRIDNDGNYEPGNCRWATRETQARNTRKNIKIGQSVPLICRQKGVSVSSFNWHYYKHGKSFDEALKLAAKVKS